MKENITTEFDEETGEWEIVNEESTLDDLVEEVAVPIRGARNRGSSETKPEDHQGEGEGNPTTR